jgi:hypothetical protein
MKKLLLSLLLLVAMVSYSQTYKRDANGNLQCVRQHTIGVKTTDVITIKDVKYPVYKSPKGKFYILRVSKNTGNEYKQYIKIEG